ncbi:MAG: ComF family protein [Actinobacteria bacterium]|nr:ComF family protein [Actinomycetota bacterium]
MGSPNTLVRELADLLLPRFCVGCSAPDSLWCPGCAARANPVARATAVQDLPILSAVEYEGPVAAAMNAYKDRGVTALYPVLAQWLLTALTDVPERPFVLCPVPQTPRHRLRRGPSPLSMVCLRAAAQLAPACRGVRPLLRRSLFSQPQRGGTRARRRAAAGLVRVATTATEPVVLVDDVVTSGTSLRGAHDVLCAAGVEVHAVIALALAADRERAG